MGGFTKKQIAMCKEEFTLVEKAIIASGGVKTEGKWHDFEVNTVCGKLGINLCVGTHIHSIFCRFEDVARAKAYFGQKQNSYAHQPNPYSGKWNFHGDEPDAVATYFLLEFKKIIVKDSGSVLGEHHELLEKSGG